jgi:hypothetical protein
MTLIFTIIDILTAIVSVLPKVVEFITNLLKMKNEGLKSLVDSGANETVVDNALNDIRESTIIATKEEFHGSGSLIPEPVIRIVYEFVVLVNYYKESWGNRLTQAIAKGFVSGTQVSNMKQAIDSVKDTYPQLFGKTK